MTLEAFLYKRKVHIDTNVKTLNFLLSKIYLNQDSDIKLIQSFVYILENVNWNQVKVRVFPQDDDDNDHKCQNSVK